MQTVSLGTSCWDVSMYIEEWKEPQGVFGHFEHLKCIKRHVFVAKVYEISHIYGIKVHILHTEESCRGTSS